MTEVVTLIGLAGVVLGALAGGIVTFVTTRSSMRLELEFAYDRALRDKRLEHYKCLFHLSKCIPRYWQPQERPTRTDLLRFRGLFHDWYFGPDAGGMFLTPAAKDLYLRLQNALSTASTAGQDGDNQVGGTPVTAGESLALRTLASDLRHQLAEDVGASHPPRLRWTRLGPTIPSVPHFPSDAAAADLSRSATGQQVPGSGLTG